ncbi:hypothetical protein Tco_0042756, partial [Tanacetum coccineum]
IYGIGMEMRRKMAKWTNYIKTAFEKELQRSWTLMASP